MPVSRKYLLIFQESLNQEISDNLDSQMNRLSRSEEIRQTLEDELDKCKNELQIERRAREDANKGDL